MRSRLICSLASAALAGAGLMFAGIANAEVTRLRIAVDELPRQDKPMEVAPKNAVLPNGTKDHGPVPKSWRKHPESGDEDDQIESSRCTDDRRASVGTLYGNSGSVMKIWEADGKVWLDSSQIDTTWSHVEVKHAERVPLARITDGLWGYRRKGVVVLVSARDIGFIEEGGFYECAIRETEISAPAGTAIVDSSPKDVNAAIEQIARNFADTQRKPKWKPQWIGVELRILASVSKSSADASTFLSLVIKRPDATPM